jgi:hypothetical protein
MPSPLPWLLHTNAGLAARVTVALCIFAALAIVDLRQHGRQATRWREYATLLLAVAAALAYGVLNDQITCSISWEYFYYGKELYQTLGPATPPDPLALHLQAALVGIQATWTVGLLLGVILLLANNPWRRLPRLPYRQLLRALPVILLCASTFAVIGGYLGWHGYLNNASPDFTDMTRANVFRPRHFLCTWGIHLGGYTGAATGTFLSVIVVLNRRFSLKNHGISRYTALPNAAAQCRATDP